MFLRDQEGHTVPQGEVASDAIVERHPHRLHEFDNHVDEQTAVLCWVEHGMKRRYRYRAGLRVKAEQRRVFLRILAKDFPVLILFILRQSVWITEKKVL